MLGNNFKQSALSGYGIGEAKLYLPEDFTKIDSFVGENALQVIKKTWNRNIIFIFSRKKESGRTPRTVS